MRLRWRRCLVLENISDTARWVAVYRALETEREDALFRDPFARTLAGTRGEQIVDLVAHGRRIAWALIVRTAVFDELIRGRVAAGAEVVVNLAAGLDARPWRMDLPASLTWIDVDLPGILTRKADELRDARPACRYEAIHADLTRSAERRAVLDRVAAAGRRALVVTEGLLIYLTEQQVGELATDLAACPAMRWWILDLVSPGLLKHLSRSMGKKLEKGNAPLRFAPDEGTDFFARFGWRELVFRSTWAESQRLDRRMRGAWLWDFLLRMQSAPRRERILRFSGNVLLERGDP